MWGDRRVEEHEQPCEALFDFALLGEDLLGLGQSEATGEVLQGALLGSVLG